MPRCRIVFLWGCVLLSAWLWSAPAPAGELLGFLKGPLHRHAPGYPGNPRQIAAPRPSPHLYGEYNVAYPWYGYGFGVPSYQWGYFGARHRPAIGSHTGYHDDFSQWGYRRGY